MASSVIRNIAFLALDDIHHLYHIVPVALELSRDPSYRCIIYVQSHCEELTRKIAAWVPEHRCQIKILSPSLLYRGIHFWRRGICSSRRIIRRYANTLLKFDGIFTPDMNLDGLIRRARNLAKRPLFFANLHGAGDAERAFHLLAAYDYVLLCGEKSRRIFTQAGYVNENNSAIIGYPKFDLIPVNYRLKLFSNDREVWLYNPHSCLKKSSWRKWGLEILEYFYQSDRYNLIFAPHCNLFRRHLSAKTIPNRYFKAENILIDLGSEKSVDMTYTQAADIYLGDVSSQVYEFIRRPRPCVFLNAHQVAWRGNKFYTSWNFGDVITDLTELQQLLSQPSITNAYTKLQQQHFADTFSITAESAAARSAAAIKQKFLACPC